tara:strand:+ start:1112 stop:1306 length:195 start_codon:yes stop_codon:yes gene_type:complete
MNYKPMFIFKGGEIAGNAQVFATEIEAENSAKARFMNWTMPTGWEVQETEEPVNYHWHNGDIRI